MEHFTLARSLMRGGHVTRLKCGGSGYVFSGSPFFPLPTEGEGAGVRGCF
jgi:hypothetical protein